MTQASHTLYCDETGNTGSRFLDPAQPLFAEGGWLISHKYKPRADKAILQIESKFGFGARELKGADLVKKAKGQAMLWEICEAVGKNGGIPYIYTVEKRYAVCSKIVETFYDSDYNPTIPTSAHWDPEKRQADAQFFYDHGGQLVEEFAEAYRLKDPGLVSSNANNWIVLLRAKGFYDHVRKIEGVLPQIEEEMRIEAHHSSSAQTPRGMDSLNLPIIVNVLQFVEQHCPYTCDIIHDEIPSLEPAYRWAFETFRNAKRSVLEMDDGRQMHTGFINALSLSFTDSKTEPLIRAADYSLAGTRKFVQHALANEPIPKDLTRVAFSTLGSFLLKVYSHIYPSLGSSPTLSGTMSSTSWNKIVFGRLENEFKNMKI
jgi:hypothetical protein